MQIDLTDDKAPALRAAILVPLAAHNQASTGIIDKGVSLSILLRDADGKVEGGMFGSAWYGWLKLEWAVIPEHRRGEGLGAKMLSSLEAAAVKHGAHGAWMQSFSFQAPGFYIKQGYHEVGRLLDRPPGHYDSFLAKHDGFAREGAPMEVSETLAPEDRLAVMEKLRAYSDQFAPPGDRRDLALLVRNKAGDILGGLWGRTGRDWLFIDLLGLPPELRRERLGTRLMDMAEAEARKRGCIGVYLDTFSFQARPFYEKRGFSVFGEIPDYPRGHTRYFLSKRLDT